MKEKRKLLTASTLAVIVLVLIFIGSTYAYLIRYWRDTDIDVPTQVTTNTTDSLMLSVDADINILATPDNYDIGMGSDTASSKATALLQANNKTKKVTANYYMYLDILTNEFLYTTEEKNPELLLHIVDPNGNIMTDINGLEYVTVTDGKGDELSGFDITTWKDTITIASNYEIATDTRISQEWEISVSFVNLATPQQANTGKAFTAKIILQKNALPIKELCSNIDFGRCLTENYTSDSNLYYHNEALANGAGDNSVRYSGSYESVNNYICFGSDEEECSHNNLYRIIGVFDNQVKLIKADYALATELGTNYAYKALYNNSGGVNKGLNITTEIGMYAWQTGNANSWNGSYLNAYNLNQTYLNTFSNEWKEKIAITSWKVGGNTGNTFYYGNAASVYKGEIVNMVTGQTAVYNKIGLMYISDYGYASSPDKWLVGMRSYHTDGVLAVNWLYNGLREWTLYRQSDNNGYAIYINNGGYVDNNGINGGLAVRPVFYLNEDVKKKSGSGTIDDPYRLINVIETNETA